MRESSKKRAKTIALVSGILTAATPGVYAGYQSAKTAWSQRVEARKTDEQETALAKNVEALRSSLRALEKSCVTQRDLVDVLLRLRTISSVPVARRSARPAVSATRRKIEVDLERVRRRARLAAAAKTIATAKAKAAPKLRKPALVRKLIQRRVPD